MYRYLVARLVQLFFVLLFLSILVFTIVRLIPGDPAAVMLGTEATPAAVAEIRREMGLDAPIPVQYLKWLQHVLRGNFGTSWVSRKPALELIVGALPVTLQLVSAAFLVALPDRCAGRDPRGDPPALLDRPGLDHVRPPRHLDAELLARHHAGAPLRAPAPVGFPRWATCR
jgi:ABC-type microcin C transport system permease subunit YejB